VFTLGFFCALIRRYGHECFVTLKNSGVNQGREKTQMTQKKVRAGLPSLSFVSFSFFLRPSIVIVANPQW
jgi:hypothetical protein